MKVVGLTGGIGSGKSTIARLFAEHGVHWVDADDVAREVVAPGTPALEAIARHFGERILLETGALNRAELRTLIFQDEQERQWLETLLHPLIRESILDQLHPRGSHLRDYQLPYTLLVSPLLLETDQHELVDRIVVIDVPVDVQIARTVARDTNTEEQIQRIIAAQMSREERLRRADHIIDNASAPENAGEGAGENAKAQVAALHDQLLAEFQRMK
jgi:dephospho-CoA kinase